MEKKAEVDLGTFEMDFSNKEDIKKLSKYIAAVQSGGGTYVKCELPKKGAKQISGQFLNRKVIFNMETVGVDLAASKYLSGASQFKLQGATKESDTIKIATSSPKDNEKILKDFFENKIKATSATIVVTNLDGTTSKITVENVPQKALNDRVAANKVVDQDIEKDTMQALKGFNSISTKAGYENFKNEVNSGKITQNQMDRVLQYCLKPENNPGMQEGVPKLLIESHVKDKNGFSVVDLNKLNVNLDSKIRGFSATGGAKNIMEQAPPLNTPQSPASPAKAGAAGVKSEPQIPENVTATVNKAKEALGMKTDFNGKTTSITISSDKKAVAEAMRNLVDMYIRLSQQTIGAADGAQTRTTVNGEKIVIPPAMQVVQDVLVSILNEDSVKANKTWDKSILSFPAGIPDSKGSVMDYMMQKLSSSAHFPMLDTVSEFAIRNNYPVNKDNVVLIDQIAGGKDGAVYFINKFQIQNGRDSVSPDLAGKIINKAVDSYNAKGGGDKAALMKTLERVLVKNSSFNILAMTPGNVSGNDTGRTGAKSSIEYATKTYTIPGLAKFPTDATELGVLLVGLKPKPPLTVQSILKN